MRRSEANSGAVVAVLLEAHLWMGSGEAVPEQAVQMVKDLLEVRGGELRDGSAGVVAATFGDAVLAVNAARNVQRMVQGFASEWKTGMLGGCTTLARVDDAGGVETTALRVSPALETMQPGQVVFVGELCDEARGIAGLELMPFVGARPMLLVGIPVRMEGYVEESPVTRGAVPVGEAKPPVASPAPAAVVTKPIGAVEGAPAVKAAAVRRETPPVGAFAREEKIAGGGGARRWGIVGAVAAVVVAGVLTFSLVLKHKTVATPGPEMKSVETPADAAQKQLEPGIAPVAGVVAKPQEPVRPVDTAAKRRSAELVKEKVPARGDAAETAVTAVPAPHGITYSAAEIGLLIAHADKDSGDGNFEKAIQEYRIVLRQEPGNEAAKRGLAKALRNQGAQ